MYQVGALKQDLEHRADNLLEAHRAAFQDLSLRSPRFAPPELGFHQAVTWLYCFYYEAGRVSLPFLLERFAAYKLAADGGHEAHYKAVQRLRTYLQHNLSLESSEDLELQRQSERWFSTHCDSAIPGDEQEWTACLVSLLTEAQKFLQVAVECVREIERDESRRTIVEQWSFRLARYHPRHEFENLVAIVAHDMGQDWLDSRRLCGRYYDKWSRELRALSGDYVFQEEARKLIEQTLLSDAEVPLPISGQDVIRQFGIPPGPEVGRLLRKARTLYSERPCPTDTLMERLAGSEGIEREVKCKPSNN